MKKWIALLLAGVLTLSCLAGCGNDKPAETPTQPAPTQPGGTPAPTQPAPAEPVIPEGVAKDQTVKILYDSEITDWNPLHPAAGGTWAN